jgi:2-amino-4-hydroxy-6-hydroxymethyldihydropteridine diphosphokinase
MIVIAIGANLPADGFASAAETCSAAVEAIDADPEIDVLARSRWYESEPMPVSDQPWYVNGAIAVETDLSPRALLARLHAIEGRFGRVRRRRNEARPLDLDIIDYNGLILTEGEGAAEDSAPVLSHPVLSHPVLPHPRMRERAFVLLPLRDLCSDLSVEWRHPVDGRSLATLIAALPPTEGRIRVLTG